MPTVVLAVLELDSLALPAAAEAQIAKGPTVADTCLALFAFSLSASEKLMDDFLLTRSLEQPQRRPPA